MGSFSFLLLMGQNSASKSDEYNTNPFKFLKFLFYLLYNMDVNLQENFFFPVWGKQALIHLPFICVERYILGDHPFYSVHCFWLTALVPDFLTNCHLAFSLSPTYSSVRTSFKQAGEFHSLGAQEYARSCSHFRTDFSPATQRSVIARCLVVRTARAFVFREPGGSRNSPLISCIFSQSVSQNRDFKTLVQILQFHLEASLCVNS